MPNQFLLCRHSTLNCSGIRVSHDRHDAHELVFGALLLELVVVGATGLIPAVNGNRGLGRLQDRLL